MWGGAAAFSVASMASNFSNSNYQISDIQSHQISQRDGRLFCPINARYQNLEGSAIWKVLENISTSINLIFYNSGLQYKTNLALETFLGQLLEEEHILGWLKLF